MFVQFILCFDVTSTNVQKLMSKKQNIVLLIYKFTSLLLVSRINIV